MSWVGQTPTLEQVQLWGGRRGHLSPWQRADPGLWGETQQTSGQVSPRACVPREANPLREDLAEAAAQGRDWGSL